MQLKVETQLVMNMKPGKLFPKDAILYPLILKALILLAPLWSFSQTDTSLNFTFDFNTHEIREKDNKVNPKASNAQLTYDRFGNSLSALQIIGANDSYLNLGRSTQLNSPNMSISLWVKINSRVYSGKGYEFIPIVVTKNGPGFDYINAFAIVYDCYVHRLSASSTLDSLDEAIAPYNDTLIFNKWYHLVAVCNNTFLAFYVDGNLVEKVPKKFETKFLSTDSLMIGHTASTKNLRYLRGVVDDIHIFHRALSPDEVANLYNAPNPNEFRNMLKETLKYILVIVALIIVIIILILRNRWALKKQKEELQLATRISELELKAVKAQMNPHFISNCMAAIQNLIYNSSLEKAGLYVAKFSFFLRQVLNYSDENYISISEEIVMIRLFVELEELRFKTGFKFNLVIDEAFNTHEIMIPALITQPFIENAIWHGLLPLKTREAQLTVRISLQNGFSIIEVEDNGVGRDLTRKTSKKNKGMKLVTDKIELLNRLSKTSNYKIRIIDLKDEEGHKLGTKIVIHLDNSKE